MRSRVAFAGILCLAMALPACCKEDGPKTPAGEIITYCADAAFSSRFAPEDIPILEKYETAIAGAKNREELQAAWMGIPELAPKPTFLQVRIYQKSEEDPEWPGSPAESVYAESVRRGLAIAIKNLKEA